jgi:hypothetical protein
MIKVYNGTTGKMAGTSHISVATGDPETCKRCKIGNICYAAKYQKLRPFVKESYLKNGIEITNRVYDISELPVVTNFQCRFNAFGEIYDGEKGDIQLTNYINIAKKNSRTIFLLWSRNYKKIETYFSNHIKPDNFKLIRSTSTIDKPIIVVPNNHIWDGVFNVVSKQFTANNNIKINCGMKDDQGKKYSCIECPTGCYHGNSGMIVFENVK